MSPAPWKNPTVVTTLMIVFFSGAAAGALIMKRRLPPEIHRSGPYWTEGGREIALQKFRRELSLNPEQEREMETVLNDFMMYYQTLQAQMDDVRATGNQRILKILKEEQKQKFRNMIGGIQSKQQIH
ncbi:MAG: hypothetical protein H7Y20_06685 [Bryobacteraceae bacterium]|nr:hypothetical protein [Bryobacteraceae bacterium]